MHLTRYSDTRPDWIEITVTETELRSINTYLHQSFEYDANGRKIHLKGKGYGRYDDFYRANGSYSCFKTCNTWVNAAFKESGMRACLWTPFDFSLIQKYN